MCDNSSNTVQQISSSSLPDWVTQGAKANYDKATQLANRPYPDYTAPRTADFSPDTLKAFDTIRSGGGYDWRTPFASAIGTTSAASSASLPTTDISKYMNPEMGAITDEIARQGAITRRQIGQSANQAGAYGSGRQGVLEGEQLRAQNNAIAQAMAGAFSDAQKTALADRAAQLAGAQSLAQLAGAGQSMGYQDLASLLGIGATEEGKSQQSLDQAYQDYLNKFQYPIEGLNLQTSVLKGSPYPTSTTTTGPGANTTAENLGSLAALVGGAGTLFKGLGGASGLGQIASGIGSGVSSLWNGISNLF